MREYCEMTIVAICLAVFVIGMALIGAAIAM